MGYKIRCQVVRVFLLENFRENIVDKEAFQKIIKRDIIPADVLPNNSEALLNYSGLLVGFFLNHTKSRPSNYMTAREAFCEKISSIFW